MFKSITSMFSPRTAEQLAEDELHEAKRQLLKHTSAMEYSRHMTNYYSSMISKLEKAKEPGWRKRRGSQGE